MLHTIPSFAQENRAGKELRVIVGYAAGGGYDAYARVVAQVLGRYLPGHPTVVVQNMPGGDGLAVANYMARVAPRDGSVIALTNRNFAVAPLLGMVAQSSAQYDPKAFNWLANLNSEVSVVIFRKDAGIRTLDDLRRVTVIVGATGLTANNAVYPYMMNNLLGTRLKVVTGYPGTNHLILSMERGEIGGIGGFSWSGLQAQRPDWIQTGEAISVLQVGLTRIPELTDVPSFLDLARNADERSALELIFAPEAMGRPFFAPPETPSPTVEVLRRAFADAVEDPDFRAASATARLDVTFTDGATLQKTVARLNAASPAVVSLARRAMEKAGTDIQQLRSP
jgi:tripartite-type tricarboxylate transporter receptor subunit TctC